MAGKAAKLIAILLAAIVVVSSIGYWTLGPRTLPVEISRQTSSTATSLSIQSSSTLTSATSLTMSWPTQWITITSTQLVGYYLSLLKSNGTEPYVQLAEGLRELPDVTNATALAQITYLALNVSNPEVTEAFQLMLRGGTPNPLDFRYPVPSYNVELELLYWLASQRQLKRDDTLALAIAMSNGLWVTIGDDSVRQQVRNDVRDLLDFFRETDSLQQARGYQRLEMLPLEAKIALSWLGGDTGTHGPHAITGSQTNYNSLDYPMNLDGYEWNNVNVTTLKQMRSYMAQKGWVTSSIDQTVANVEDYFFFSGFSQHFNYVSSWAVTTEVNGETVPVRNMNNANFNFYYYLQNGKAIGVCEDEMTLVSAFMKSWGIATLPMSAYWFSGTTIDPRDVSYSVGGNSYGGHTYTMYYDAASSSWKVFPLQIGIVFSYVRDAYIFLPPVLQNEFIPSGSTPMRGAAVPYPFKTGEVNANMFAPMLNITGTYLNIFKRGVASTEMKEWILYKTRPPTVSVTFARWDYEGEWNIIQGSTTFVGPSGGIVGDLGQPYVGLANVSYAFSNGSIFFRFVTHGSIPSALSSHVGGFWYQVLIDIDSDSVTGYHWSSDFTPDYILEFSVGIDPSTNAPSVYSDLLEHCGRPEDWCWTSVGFTQYFGRTPLVAGGVGQTFFVLTCEYQDIMVSSGSTIRFFARSGIMYDNQVYNDNAPNLGTISVSLP